MNIKTTVAILTTISFFVAGNILFFGLTTPYIETIPEAQSVLTQSYNIAPGVLYLMFCVCMATLIFFFIRDSISKLEEKILFVIIGLCLICSITLIVDSIRNYSETNQASQLIQEELHYEINTVSAQNQYYTQVVQNLQSQISTIQIINQKIQQDTSTTPNTIQNENSPIVQDLQSQEDIIQPTNQEIFEEYNKQIDDEREEEDDD